MARGNPVSPLQQNPGFRCKSVYSRIRGAVQPMCGVTRVYPPSIFRSRKLRLATLIVGLQGFYFIPGPPNPTVASANRHFGDHFRVHLVRTTNKQTNNIRDRFQ